MPSVRSVGTFASGTTSCAPGLPTGWQQDDIFVLVVESGHSGPELPNDPSGWIRKIQDPQGSGNTAVALTVYVRRATASESAPTVDGTTNHIHAQIAAVQDVDPGVDLTTDLVVGAPWSSDSDAVVIPGITTTEDDSLVLMCFAHSFNGNNSSLYTSYANANLTGVAGHFNQAETTGSGGGVGLASGTKATAGATGDSTATAASAVSNVAVHIAIPAAVGGGATPATAAIDQTLPALTQDVTVEVVIGADIAQALPALTQDASAEALLEAALAQVLPALTQDASAEAVVEAALAQVLPALTQSVTAEVTDAASAAIDSVLPALTQDAVVESSVEAAIVQALPALTQAVVGESFVEAVIAQVLPALTQAADAEVTLEAAIAQVLPALTQAATAQAVSEAEAIIASVLPALTQAVTAEVLVEGSADSVLPALTQDATAAAAAPAGEAAIAQNLPALRQRARTIRFNTGGGKEGYVVWRYTNNPDKTKRRLPFAGGRLR